PEILAKINGDFIVTFHGYSASRGLLRGIAATRDWRNWNPLANGPIYSLFDCPRWTTAWNGRCFGGGAATIASDSGYYYMLIESEDTSPTCIDGSTDPRSQLWAFGLLRSRSLTTPSPQWETDETRGLAFSSREKTLLGGTVGCGVLYGKFFKDG